MRKSERIEVRADAEQVEYLRQMAALGKMSVSRLVLDGAMAWGRMIEAEHAKKYGPAIQSDLLVATTEPVKQPTPPSFPAEGEKKYSFTTGNDGKQWRFDEDDNAEYLENGRWWPDLGDY